jgi:hypothetical protein
MNLLTNKAKAIRYSSIACLISVIGLLSIWVLPNTIALRHALILIGLMSAITIIFKSEFFKGLAFKEIYPLVLFSLIFIWPLIHFFFFSLDPALESQELRSVWLRALAGSITAIGLSISLRILPSLRPYFYICVFIVSLINLGAYLFFSYQNEGFILPTDFVTIFVFKKIEAAFFGVIAIALACANLIIVLEKKYDRKNILTIFLWFLGITMAIISSVVANTKNGVAVALGLCFLLALSLLFKAVFQGGSSRWRLILPVLFVSMLLAGGWKVHSKFASQGWGTVLEDVVISSQLDKHNFWRYNSPHWNKVRGEIFPKNSYGIPVAGNTYERVSWATQGVLLISQYPMGYGSINRSFVGMLNYANVQQELESQTHSGWIDFGLAYGLPGLAILLLVFISIIYKGIISRTQFGLMATWLIIGFIPFGIVAEICYKHNFEILIFFTAFAAASTISIPHKKFEISN